MVRATLVRDRVKIPEGVSVSVEGGRVSVRGPKGEVSRDFSHAVGVTISVEDGEVVVMTTFARREDVARVYSVSAHIRNMILGVSRGYRYWLRVIYSHFPISVRVEGNKVLIENFIGERSPRIAEIVGKAYVKVQKNDIIVEGIDVEEVSQTAANIEQATKIRGLDRRVFADGIYIYKREFMDGGEV
ncbi:MAG: 50S ribosomal protein L6 [Zestosphaera sp.]